MAASLNPNNLLGRHSGAGRNPVINSTLQSGQNHDVVPLAWEIFNHLDSGLLRNDAAFTNGQSGLNNMLQSVLVVLLCMFSIADTAFAAEQLNDPTRPAIELVPGLGGAATAEQKAPPAGLQSVILSPKREAAIINGIEVAVGEKYGDAVLTVVNETCVVLMGPEGRRVMHMFPTVNMSKTELACVRRQGMQPISQAAGRPAKIAKAIKKAKAKKRVVVCAPVEENKDGSGK
jgi:hypothetical protein